MDTPSSSDAIPRKRLYRSRSDRLIDGVCGGLGAYFDVDPVWIRVGWVVLVLIGGWVPVLAYIAALIILPNAPREMDEALPYRRHGRGYLFGIIMMAIGLLLLLSNFHLLPWEIWRVWRIPWEMIWGIGLVLLGLMLILFRRKDAEETDDEAASTGPRRRLLRARSDRMIGGVCGGLAVYFGVDPSLVRFGWVVVTLAPAWAGAGSVAIGILAYVAMLIIVPQEPRTQIPPDVYEDADEQEDGR